MLAKVIAYGSTRGQAIDKLCKELQSVHFGGFNNNIEFLINILIVPPFLIWGSIFIASGEVRKWMGLLFFVLKLFGSLKYWL